MTAIPERPVDPSQDRHVERDVDREQELLREHEEVMEDLHYEHHTGPDGFYDDDCRFCKRDADEAGERFIENYYGGGGVNDHARDPREGK